MKFFKCILLFLFTIVFLSGCTAADSSISPTEYYNLLSKSKEFISFCLFVANQENPYWGQIVSRVYYSYFSIARIIHISKTNKYERVKHDVIWKQNKKYVRKEFGYTLKKLREYYDYDPKSEIESEKNTITNLKNIICDEKPFEELIGDAKIQITKFYKNEKKANDWIEKCNTLLDDIEKEHDQLKTVISKKSNLS